MIREENIRQSPHGSFTLDNGRIFVPEYTQDGTPLRTALIAEAHNPPIHAHPGRNRTIATLYRYYHRTDLCKDVERFVMNCHACRRNKTPRDKHPGLLHPLPIPTETWQHVRVDGKDMPTDRRGYNYVWAFVDKLSRVMATLPGQKTDSAEDLAGRYYRHLFRIFGMSDLWLTNNGPQFVSKFVAKINELTGTKHKRGSTYHPQTQGGVEITNQELDQKFHFYLDKVQDTWSDHLPALDFAHNSKEHSSLKMSPLKVLLGREARILIAPEIPATTPNTLTEEPASSSGTSVPCRNRPS